MRDPLNSIPRFALVVVLAVTGLILWRAAEAPLGSARAASAAGESWKAVVAAVKAGGGEDLAKALEALLREGGQKNQARLLKLAAKIPAQRDELYWQLIRGAASFVDRVGLEELGKYVLKQKKKPIARDLLYALARNRSPAVSAALGPILASGPADLRQQAADGLAQILDPGSVDALIAALEAEEASRAKLAKRKKKPSAEDEYLLDSIVLSLTSITGKAYGPNSVNWKSWWAQNRGKPLVGGGLAKVRGESEGRTGTAADHLDGLRKKAFIGLENAPEKGVVVVSALYTRHKQLKPFKKDVNNDYMEQVCARMNVPHTVVRREDFLGFDLSETGAILINCATFHKQCVNPTHKGAGPNKERLRRCLGEDHINLEPAFRDEELKKLEAFVTSGGYVFCEDWVVREFIDKVYSDYVTSKTKLKTQDVDVVPERGQASHPYLKGMFVAEPQDSGYFLDELDLGDDDDDDDDDAGGRTVVQSEEDRKREAKLVDVVYQWKIDDESYTLEVKNPSKVVTLLTSGKLEKEVGDNAVAVAFRPGSNVPVGRAPSRSTVKGSGVVLCVLSHFGKQGSSEDERTIENLLLNFLIDADVARRVRSGGRK